METECVRVYLWLRAEDEMLHTEKSSEFFSSTFTQYPIMTKGKMSSFEFFCTFIKN